MTLPYDNYYQTENLFGTPYPELIAFFSKISNKEKILDLGCGQGRDSIALARLGFDVTGIDNSKVGIEQMNQIAQTENLKLNGLIGDIYKYDNFSKFGVVLLDSMFHFAKKDRKRETEFIQRIISKIKKGCILIVCIQDTGKKVEILNDIFDKEKQIERYMVEKFEYIFEDKESKHHSKTNYQMIAVKK